MKKNELIGLFLIVLSFAWLLLNPQETRASMVLARSSLFLSGIFAFFHRGENEP